VGGCPRRLFEVQPLVVEWKFVVSQFSPARSRGGSLYDVVYCNILLTSVDYQFCAEGTARKYELDIEPCRPKVNVSTDLSSKQEIIRETDDDRCLFMPTW
jgi:hypothetical protein